MTSKEQSKRQAFSVNIPDDKKEAWAKIAKAHNRPMGWLFVEMVDRMIEADSIHVYKDSDDAAGSGLSMVDVEKAIRVQMSQLDTVTPDDVRSMIETALIPISDELGTLQSQLAKLMAVALDGLSQRNQQSLPKSKLK